ncbi:TRAP transporter small permease [Hoeflea sp. YIM 152468]|uniref:TRAP transporter small permease n=1 Tax=Hoeflea sp. YIM 152468 TaxID=3031759 RepID=UPI0023DC3E78|nr:TRAP transporter small permease [Hoeflea sp. YIM 152468]MDF1609072.1 TRAP transporter small permease [Hoeflea sp. YIM 152468]
MHVRNPQLAHLMHRILVWVARISMVLACLSLALLVLLFIAVIGLRFFGISVPSADDIAGILLGGTFALGFAAAVPGDQHISVDFFINRMKPSATALLKVVAYVVTIAIIGYLLLGFSRIWYAAYQSGITMLGTLPIPRALPMGIVMAGLAMLELALVLRFLERMFGTGFALDERDLPSGAH